MNAANRPGTAADPLAALYSAARLFDLTTRELAEFDALPAGHPRRSGEECDQLGERQEFARERLVAAVLQAAGDAPAADAEADFTPAAAQIGGTLYVIAPAGRLDQGPKVTVVDARRVVRATSLD